MVRHWYVIYGPPVRPCHHHLSLALPCAVLGPQRMSAVCQVAVVQCPLARILPVYVYLRLCHRRRHRCEDAGAYVKQHLVRASALYGYGEHIVAQDSEAGVADGQPLYAARHIYPCLSGSGLHVNHAYGAAVEHEALPWRHHLYQGAHLAVPVVSHRSVHVGCQVAGQRSEALHLHVLCHCGHGRHRHQCHRQWPSPCKSHHKAKQSISCK